MESPHAEAPRPRVAVIVPTRNESGNVAPLVERLDDALAGFDAEILFVDDSDDDTPDQVRFVARTSRVPVAVHHRRKGQREGGLGGAVIAGLQRVDKTWAVVMDGDLQHPPSLVPIMVAEAEQHRVDVVVASRHVEGGSAAGLSNALRVLVSGASTVLAKALFPHRLEGVSDPMSGFFLIRRAAVDVALLRPHGFKILLEVLARTPRLSCSELPFAFGERLCGESKASLREGTRFVRQLLTIWLDRVRSLPVLRSGPAVLDRGALFAAVGATGLVVNTAVMWALADGVLGVNYLVAAVVATQVSSTWNFSLAESVVYPGPKRFTVMRRWLTVMAISNAILVLRVPLLALLVSVLGAHYLVANVITLSLGFLARFSSQERLSLVKEASTA